MTTSKNHNRMNEPKVSLSDLIGTWRCEGLDSSVAISVSKLGSKWVVRVWNVYDGENYQVSHLRVKHSELQFKVTVPSSGFMSLNVLSPVTKRTMHLELTVFETWVRVAKPGIRKNTMNRSAKLPKPEQQEQLADQPVTLGLTSTRIRNPK